ncbi:MAG: endolytic transglycosylase MltG [Anaerolinea sp.]|nr:endolytic transglycosylase MltG [Anaerolinea sp.]
MVRRKSSSALPFVLVLLLVVVGLGIAWLGVPILAEKSFGRPAENLTTFQKWSYSLQVLLHKKELITPLISTQSDVPFTIAQGASVSSVALGLEKKGLISNWVAFRYYVIYKGLDTQIKAGEFSLSPSMSAVEISEAIQSIYSEEVAFYIYPGWRAEEIAAALPSSGIEVSPEVFLSVVQNPINVNLPIELTGIPSLEGFLFPGDYIINRKISPENLALAFTQRFSESVTDEIKTNLQNNGLTFYQSIILASIVQRETFEDNERSLIASVFFNRLTDGMKLETDPTVQYALGYNEAWGGWWKTPLLVSDLSYQSSYNTYLIAGLPEQPISNPGVQSILAVATPETSPYYYFRARCDGSGTHIFSQTFEEHLSNACN